MTWPSWRIFGWKCFAQLLNSSASTKPQSNCFSPNLPSRFRSKALEDELGIRLFDRAGGHVSLTRQGALLLRHEQKLAAVASEAEQELAAAEGQLAGNLEIGVSTTIAQYVLPRLIAAFLAENRRLQLSLQSGNTEEIVQLLVQDKVSIGLIEGPSREQGVRIEPFMQDELVLITPPDFESDRLSRDQ